jgi:hypothetical protein
MTEQLTNRKIENVFETLYLPEHEYMLTGRQLYALQLCRHAYPVRSSCANGDTFVSNGLSSLFGRVACFYPCLFFDVIILCKNKFNFYAYEREEDLLS